MEISFSSSHLCLRMTDFFYNNVLQVVFLCITTSLGLAGFGAIVSTSAGLDQMPGASSENINSFLNWEWYMLANMLKRNTA